MFVTVAAPMPEDLDVRLGALVPGLKWAMLREVLLVGQAAFDNATDNHPATAPGWYRWSEENRALRDGLVLLGCTPFNDQNIPKSRTPDGRVVLYAKGGNLDTGLPHRIPSTQRPLGRAARKHVLDPHQLMLLPEPSREVSEETWLLLRYYLLNPRKDEELIRAELSLPGRIDRRGHVIGWRDRIFLPVIDLTHDVNPGGDDDSEPDAEVRIKRRRG